jgi:hypothetical protein
MRLVFTFAALAALSPLGRTDEPKPAKPDPARILVPYRLTKTNHVLVRAKINGKGPFNFILDTGAPALFVSKKAADAVGLGTEIHGWTTFDRFEVEGGAVFERAKGRVDDLFQLEGINGLGLAGVELHGVIGYNLLARYRIEYDFTRPKLAWTKLDFEPPTVGSIGGKSAPAGLEMIGGMMKFLGGMMGVQANFAVQPRGFLGAEFADANGTVTVKAVLADGPAAKAGLQTGDIVKRIDDKPVKSAKELAGKIAGRPEGNPLSITVSRDGKETIITLELGRGL